MTCRWKALDTNTGDTILVFQPSHTKMLQYTLREKHPENQNYLSLVYICTKTSALHWCTLQWHRNEIVFVFVGTVFDTFPSTDLVPILKLLGHPAYMLISTENVSTFLTTKVKNLHGITLTCLQRSLEPSTAVLSILSSLRSKFDLCQT